MIDLLSNASLSESACDSIKLTSIKDVPAIYIPELCK